MAATFFNGIINSLGHIQDIIAKKAMDGLDWQITVLVMIWPVANLFSIWWGKLLERTERKSRFFLLVAFAGRLTLMLGLWITNVNQFILLLAVVHSFSSLFIPLQNSLMQANFRPQIRGRVFGYSMSVITVIVLISSYISGRLLDYNEEYYRYLLLIFGIMGFTGSFILSFAKFNKRKITVIQKKLNFREIFLAPLIRTFDMLKKHKTFARFEMNFFIYGIGFLIVLPIIPKYLVEDLEMSYTLTFLGKGIVSQLGILFLSPIAGRVFDKGDPCRFSGMAFTLLAFYPITFLISSFFANRIIAIYLVFLAYIIFGIAMSGVSISWHMSSIYFAGDEDASMFQSVHVTLTGLRGLIVPLIGYGIMKLAGIRAVFGVSAVAFFTAAYLSHRLSRNLGCMVND
jgi:MFS family permease